MAVEDLLGIVGEVIDDKYEVERLVGEGGFAMVYRALHRVWKKPVALKLFSGLSAAPADQREALVEAFITEGALLSELSTRTANIVQARDVGEYTAPSGQWMPFMVLEWLDGSSLEEVLDNDLALGRSPFTIREAYDALDQVVQALHVAHSRGVAHRDIKPANFFVIGGDVRAGDVTIKLLDFGVAKMVGENTEIRAAMAKTGLGITSFTPQYGAPEQFSRKHGATGPWTDVFALALVLTEMSAGKTALEGEDIGQLGYSASDPEVRPTPRTLGVDTTDAVESVFRKALAVKVPERFQTVADFWQQLAAALDAPASKFPTPPRSAAAVAKTEIAPSAAATELVAPPMSDSPTLEPTAQSKRSSGGAPIAVGVAVIAGAAAAGFFVLRSEDPEPAAPEIAAPPVEQSAEKPAPPPACPEGMAQIPAGQFFMGSDDEAAPANQKPSHNVTLNAFCMDETEVTVEAFSKCSDAGKCRRARGEASWPKISEASKAAHSPLCNERKADRAQHPINCVTWEQADNYCRVNDKRLPTEAEWEYAARGPDGRKYPWGDEPPTPKHLNACGSECTKWGDTHSIELRALFEADDGFPATSPVATFPLGRSRFGPHDVVGNVWEWVADWSATYTKEARKNPQGPDSGEKRVIRGGAWNGGFSEWLHPAFRYAQVPDARSPAIGFRCAKDLVGVSP